MTVVQRCRVLTLVIVFTTTNSTTSATMVTTATDTQAILVSGFDSSGAYRRNNGNLVTLLDSLVLITGALGYVGVVEVDCN